ncbi:MAG: hypothetical protein J7513_15825 [Solirubrobacteraceae bacterium]|nr:hypothetical protein [Solirubrobacteraceae bacterium]
MFRWTYAATLCAALAVVLPVAPAGAAPVSKKIGADCSFPGARGQGGLTVTAPFAWSDQRGTAALKVTVRDEYLRLRGAGIGSVDGYATLKYRVTDGPTTTSRTVTARVPLTAVDPVAPTDLELGDAIPAVANAQGAVTIWLQSVTLDLNAWDADGFPMPVEGRPTADASGEQITQPDDPTAFRAPCINDVTGGFPVATFLAGTAPVVPLTPPAVVSVDPGYRSLAIDWSKPAGSFPISGYRIESIVVGGPFSGEALINGAPGSASRTVVFPGGGTYSVRMTIQDVTGAEVEFYESENVRTLGVDESAPVTRTLNAKATVNLPSIAKQPFTLSGTANLTFTSRDHAVTGTIDFQPVLTRLTVRSSGLPISSKVALVRSGPATGTFTNSLLNVTQSVRVKVLDARAFGAVPIELGNACQTKSLTPLALSSGEITASAFAIPFVRYGGTVTSRFPVSDLNGCAAIAEGFDPAAASTAGDISVSLTDPPATSAATSGE